MVVNTTTYPHKELSFSESTMLSSTDIITLIEKKELIIDPFNERNVGCASIDLTLSDQFVRYVAEIDSHSVHTSTISFSSSNITLPPGGFVLGMTRECVRMPPQYYGFIETRGNFARAGISISSNDGHIDPGTDGNITLEIYNRNTVDVTLHSGDQLCQLFLFSLNSLPLRLYTGRYAHQIQPTVFSP